jgi:glycosyltransferase involved in cell wall biosynthesis
MPFSLVVGSFELFVRQGTGIRTFSRSLVTALGSKKGLPLDLLISTTSSSESGMLAGSNIFQVHVKKSKLYRAAFIARLKIIQLLRISLWPSVRRLQRISAAHPLCRGALEKCFGEPATDNILEPTHEAEEQTRDKGLLCSKYLFDDATILFKLNRRLLHLSLPRQMRGRYANRPLYHSPLPYPVVINGCLNVCTIHDLIPISHPELCLDDPSCFYDLVDSLLNVCDGIHCISYYSAEQLKTYYGNKGDGKIFVAHQPIPLSHLTSGYQESVINAHRRQSALGSSCESKYILQVGSIEPKKNHQTTFNAFRRLREKNSSLRLVIIGKPGWLTEDLCDYLSAAKPDGIEWVRSANYGTLIRYLQGASAVVFPSLVEGWGLPPLEAMSFGTPVVVSPIQPCKEACGSSPLYMTDPLDPISLSDNLQNILSTPELVEQLIKNGFEQVKKYNAEQFAHDLFKGYSKIAA